MSEQLTRMYVLYDELAEECGPVYYAPNDAVAARKCARLMIDSRTEGVMPGDVQDDIFQGTYKLYYIGSLDPKTCRLVPADKLVPVDYSGMAKLMTQKPNMIEVAG